jgi:cell division protein FtsQ
VSERTRTPAPKPVPRPTPVGASPPAPPPAATPARVAPTPVGPKPAAPPPETRPASGRRAPNPAPGRTRGKALAHAAAELRRPDRARRGAPPTPVSAAATPVGVDPRIKRRWIEVRRDEGRRRLRVLVASLVVMGMVVGAVGATRSPVLDVDHVVLVGGTHTTAAQARQAARLEHHPQLIDVDTAAIARRVEALPWVQTAHAERQWPATVKVAITERVPVASVAVPASPRWAVVDGSGRVLEVDDARPDTMPSVVVGPSVAGSTPPATPGASLDRQGRDAARVVALMPEALRGITADVDVVAGGQLEIHVVPFGVIRLGEGTELADKLQSAVTVLSTLKPGSWQFLDVRVPRAPVLTRR